MLYYEDDISNGLERIGVSAINDQSDKAPTATSFIYIKTTQIDSSLEEFQTNEGCNCKQCEVSTCPCFKSGADGKGYTFMKFCDPSTCPCSSQTCENHGTGSGSNKFRLNAAMEVFFVNAHKQWGVRAKKKIGKNIFVCEYAGILTRDSDDVEEDSYIYTLNYRQRAFMINAGSSGNVARFINHSCDPNLAAVVAIYGQKEIPRLLLFSLRSISANEELSINYGDGWWKAKGLDCLCATKNCRYIKKENTLSAIL